MRRGPWRVALVVSLLVAAGLPIGWALTRPQADVGGTATAAPPFEVQVPTPVATPAPATSATVAATSARAAELPPAAVAAPVHLRVPTLGIDAEVEPVGAEADGEMEVPGDVATVGWYRPGTAPDDDQGTVVLAGHVDSRAAGPGAFFALERSQPGDEVVVTLSDGRERRYEIVGRRRHPKAALPVTEIFTRAGAPRLALITCGGAFDSRRYADNVVVYAVPA